MAPTYEPKAKRRKLDQPEADQVYTIGSARDLHDLLRFKQSSSPEVKNAIQQFKGFLADIGKTEDDSDRANKLRVLKEYCDDQSSADKPTTSFPDLMSTWSFAAQSNNDSILSAVPAVLALFLRTISTQIQFRDFGLSLCRTLLEKDQLRLFDRGLTSPKNKEFLISPCLRLLTEVVSFDGGAVANSLYSRRDTVFKRLDILLDHGSATNYEDEDQKRRPTVRRNGQRYVLANLRFQSSGVKGDLIAEGKILRRALQGINRDGSDMIADILTSIKKDILEDAMLPRKSKTRFFSAANLGAIASVYSVSDSEHAAETGALEDAITLDIGKANGNAELTQEQKVRTVAHELLLSICTKQENGVFLSDSGWYPLGSDPEEIFDQDEEAIDLGLDSPLQYDNYDHKIPVKNGTLATFIQGLRPASDALQAALLLKIFEAAPELVADYFSKQRTFTSEPKAEPSWLGEAAFLFSVMELPIPAYCGWNSKLPTMPPPSSIVIESILPRPLDQLTIARCLNLNHKVITLFAARVVTVALIKLQKILGLFRIAPHERELWNQASDKLKIVVSERCPQIKVVIQALQRAPKDDVSLRGALTELLAAFFRVLPSIALKEKFDPSTALTEVMNRLDAEIADEGEKGDLLEQMSHLVFVAEMSPLTNWWNKSGSDLSAFCRLLQTAASSSANRSIKALKAIVRNILVERGVLTSEPETFDALLASLNMSKKWSPTAATYAFIDNCISRVVRQPVHYLDLSAMSLGEGAESSSWGTLVACIAEQWPFVTKNDDPDAQKDIAEWIARFFSALGGDKKAAGQATIGTIGDGMVKTTEGTPRSLLEKAFKKHVRHPVRLQPLEDTEKPKANGHIEMEEDKRQFSEVGLEDLFGAPARSPSTLQGLDRWENADLESAVSSGRLGRLLQCIASREEEIRRQAFLILRQLMLIVKDSSYIEKGPVYLLLGEVCETVQSCGFEMKVPSIFAEMAAQIVTVLADPSHKIYGKVNKFLNKAPSWDAQKTISFWIDRILLREPEDDDEHNAEINWLLEVLVNGLRNAEDMELYRKANVFERILSLHCSPQGSAKARRKILQVVYRAVQVGGGMTLITRAGILSWLDIQLAVAKGQDTGVIQALKSAVESSSDFAEVEAWKGRSTKQ